MKLKTKFIQLEGRGLLRSLWLIFIQLMTIVLGFPSTLFVMAMSLSSACCLSSIIIFRFCPSDNHVNQQDVSKINNI